MRKNRPTLLLELEREQPGRRQVSAWRENVSSLYEVSVDEREEHRFRGHSIVYHLGTAILGRTRVTGHHIQRTPSLIARMGVDHWIVNLRDVGAFHPVVDGTAIDIASGDISFFDMTRPWEASSTDYSGITIAFPRKLLAPFFDDLDAAHGLVIRGDSPLGALASEHLRALSAHADRFKPFEAEAAIRGTVALLAACALCAATPARDLRATADPAIMLALRRFIDTNLAEPGLSADHLAKTFGLSRSGLYRSFEPLGGVATYIRRCRLAAAYRELSNVRLKTEVPRIQEIARRWQFHSVTTFDHSFKKEFGSTPRDVRAEALARSTTDHRPPDGQHWTNLYQWVLDLSA